MTVTFRAAVLDGSTLLILSPPEPLAVPEAVGELLFLLLGIDLPMMRHPCYGMLFDSTLTQLISCITNTLADLEDTGEMVTDEVAEHRIRGALTNLLVIAHEAAEQEGGCLLWG